MLLILELLGAETGELEASFAKTACGKFGGRTPCLAGFQMFFQSFCCSSESWDLRVRPLAKKCHGNPRHQIMDDLSSLYQSLQQIEFMSIPNILDHPRMFSGVFSHPSSIVNRRLGYVMFVVKILIGRLVGRAIWH